MSDSIQEIRREIDQDKNLLRTVENKIRQTEAEVEKLKKAEQELEKLKREKAELETKMRQRELELGKLSREAKK